MAGAIHFHKVQAVVFRRIRQCGPLTTIPHSNTICNNIPNRLKSSTYINMSGFVLDYFPNNPTDRVGWKVCCSIRRHMAYCLVRERKKAGEPIPSKNSKKTIRCKDRWRKVRPGINFIEAPLMSNDGVIVETLNSPNMFFIIPILLSIDLKKTDDLMPPVF